MSDEIRLSGLRVRGTHGVFDFEKRDGQDFIVDVVVRRSVSHAARSDDLADTVDYGALAQRTAAIVGGEPFDLIEALAGCIADDLLGSGLLDAQDALEVTVHKPQAPIPLTFGDVSVTVRREAGDSAALDRPGGQAVVSLGSNVGDSGATLAAALNALDAHPDTHVLAWSQAWSTEPVGGVAQDDFLNATVILGTALSPRELLRVCQGIEVALGRTREVRWGPRTLDIDLIRFVPLSASLPGGAASETVSESIDAPESELVTDDPALTLPHPRAHERAFVLAPWAQVRPAARVRAGSGEVETIDAAVTSVREQRVAPAGSVR